MCILEGEVQEYPVWVGYTPPKKILPPLMILDHQLHWRVPATESQQFPMVQKCSGKVEGGGPQDCFLSHNLKRALCVHCWGCQNIFGVFICLRPQWLNRWIQNCVVVFRGYHHYTFLICGHRIWLLWFNGEHPPQLRQSQCIRNNKGARCFWF